MTIVGNRQRLCFCGWILAGMLLIALNWFNYTSLENRPLVGDSSLIVSLRNKLSRMKDIQSSGKLTFTSLGDNHSFFTQNSNKASNSNPKMTSSNSEQPQSELWAKLLLPPLSGIMKVTDQKGNPRYLAVLADRVYQEKERVMGFTIESITAKGVELHKSGVRHFIKSPEINFSKDQGK
jgi:hypothetical protein